jgi:hypothetical protein
MRIWLPDAPGVLSAVTAEIGTLQGNVVGLEVLEREAGVAIDEFVVELPDDSNVVDAVCRGVRNVPGAGVEEVTVVPSAAPDRVHGVLAAAAEMVRADTAAEILDALTGQLSRLFDLAWLAVADERLKMFVEVKGDAPTPQWVAAFAEGARSGADPANDTLRSGVFVEALPEAAVVVCGGRPAAIRHRERHEISVLVMVASRLTEVLGGRAGPVV